MKTKNTGLKIIQKENKNTKISKYETEKTWNSSKVTSTSKNE